MKIKTITKKKLSKKICKKVLKSEVLTREKYENYSFCGDKTSFKCGLYFLFNEEYEILYIGMVGNASNTSLYDRMVGHGSGSHKQKDKRWYSFVKWCKFYRFNGLNDNELKQLERLAIFGMGQPPYNDVDINKEDILFLYNKI